MSTSFAWLVVSAILITPRIQLISLAGSFIRLEDLLFVINFLWLIFHKHKLNLLPRYIANLLKTIVVMSLVGLISALFAAVSGRNSLLTGILFSLRPLEYATLIPSIFLILNANLKSIDKLLKILTITTFVSSILQVFFSLEIGTNRFGFSRSSAFTGGPYELAMISVLLSIYWFKNRQLLLVFICLVSLIASASRISVFAISIAFCILAFGEIRRERTDQKLGRVTRSNPYKSILIILIILLVSIGSSVSVNFNQILTKYQLRLQNTESNSLTFRESYALSKSVPDITTSNQYSEFVFLAPPDFTGGFESSDASTRRRYFVWFVLLETFLNSKAFVLGLGPGFGGSAVDGNFVRIVAEYGFLGIIIYWKWFGVLFKRSTYWFKAALTSVLVTGIYIDIFTSIKTTLLLYIFFLVSNSEFSPFSVRMDSD